MLNRMLLLKTGESVRTLAVSIGEPSGSGTIWECPYEIDWPDAPKRGTAHGVDGMQATYLAMQMIGTDLYTSNEHADGRIGWPESPAGGYGFPLPKTLRSLLVGLDKQLLG